MTDEEKSIVAIAIADDGVVPNSVLPLLVYRSALEILNEGASAFESLFHANRWENSWRNGVFSYHHYHSTAHEVLGCYSGSAIVQFGGENGAKLNVHVGDAVLIPAGVAHKKISSRGHFAVVGAYPAGQRHDMCTGKSNERPKAVENIAQVPLPELDPVCGESGGIHQHWFQ